MLTFAVRAVLGESFISIAVSIESSIETRDTAWLAERLKEIGEWPRGKAPAFEAGRRWFESNLPSHSEEDRKVARVADWRRLLTGWGHVLHERSNRSPSARDYGEMPER